MSALLVALAGAYGVFLLYTAYVLGWRGLALGPAVGRGGVRRRRVEHWLAGAGLAEVRRSELLAVTVSLFVAGALLAYALFDAAVPAVVLGGFAATGPLASLRFRRQRALEEARQAWPRMIEEMRLLIGSLGRSVPQALFEVGATGPEQMRAAFAAAQREWLISTDFTRTVAVLKARLGDATADAACETLLVAHEVGGSDVDRRLAALAEDRIADLQGRKDAEAKQSGARFARRFVLLVPFGMALVGVSIGNGRAAYGTPSGQLGVTVGLLMVIACWLWSGRLMRLPEEQRVFHE